MIDKVRVLLGQHVEESLNPIPWFLGPRPQNSEIILWALGPQTVSFLRPEPHNVLQQCEVAKP